MIETIVFRDTHRIWQSRCETGKQEWMRVEYTMVKPHLPNRLLSMQLSKVWQTGRRSPSHRGTKHKALKLQDEMEDLLPTPRSWGCTQKASVSTKCLASIKVFMWIWVFSAIQETGTIVHWMKAWIRSQEYLVTLSLLQKECRTCLWMWRQFQGNPLMAKRSSSQATPVHKRRKRRNLHQSPNSSTHYSKVFNKS